MTELVGEIIGATVVDIRKMTEEELEREGWEEFSGRGAPVVIVFDNGSIIYASRDEEGNGYGSLFGADPNGTTFLLLAPPED